MDWLPGLEGDARRRGPATDDRIERPVHVRAQQEAAAHRNVPGERRCQAMFGVTTFLVSSNRKPGVSALIE
jgi:hypothetical protein